MIKFENTEVAQIKDFPNYFIDRMGNVYNKNGYKLKQEVLKNGYVRVSLSNNIVKHKHFLVHRLVALTFIPNPNNYPQINHKDYNKQNNRLENLEWCSPLQNLDYSDIINKASMIKHNAFRRAG